VSAVAHSNRHQRDIERIAALPRRAPLDCERDELRRWSVAAQALIDLMTMKYTRGPRLSCGCRKRHLIAGANGALTVFPTAARSSQVPPSPIFTTVDDFCADNRHDIDIVRQVSGMRNGQSLDLVGLDTPFCLTQLNAVQAWILYELPTAQGIHGLISVGGGKSLSGILAPLAMPPHVRTVALLAKPSQRLHYKNAYLRAREHFHVPSIVFNGSIDSATDGSYIVPGTPVLHFLPYSVLSGTKNTMLLDSINPDAIVADESHSLSNRMASRTMRFLRHMTTRTDIIFVNWSGSTIKKSIKDASHLAAHSLGLGSPYPIKPKDVDEWSAVIDPSREPDTESTTAVEIYRAFAGRDIEQSKSANAIKYLVGGGDAHEVREGLRDRVIHTYGVISTVSSSVTASIEIRERKPPKLPDSIREHMMGVRRDDLRPDGEVLLTPLETVMCARNLAAGFYERWVYPKGEDPSLILEWFARRKIFAKELRTQLRRGEPHLDSKALCENAAARAWQKPAYEGDLPLWPAASWPEWIEVKDLVKPEPRVVWVDEFLARDAAEWATKNKGVVWCASRAFGLKVASILKLPYYAGGKEATAQLDAEKGDRSVVCSIPAFGTGYDGAQFKFSKQLIAEVPASSEGWQQLLGRLCREGQDAETIETDVYVHTQENRDALRQAIDYAEYVEATTPNRQLLLAADMDFIP
jgi:hypothetical protein